MKDKIVIDVNRNIIIGYTTKRNINNHFKNIVKSLTDTDVKLKQIRLKDLCVFLQDFRRVI